MTDAEWATVLSVNLTAVFLCMKHEITAMLASEYTLQGTSPTRSLAHSE